MRSNLSALLFVAGLALLLSGLASQALASSLAQATQDRLAGYAVQVRNRQANGDCHTGSGVLVDAGGVCYVATNHHVAAKPRGALELTFADGRRSVGTIVADDPEMDVVIIRPAADVRGGAPLGCFTGRGRYWIAGFGGAEFGRLHFHETTMARLAGLGRGRWSWSHTHGNICPGDSGAGVFNEQLECVGVMWGTEQARAISIGTLGRPFEELFLRLQYVPQQWQSVDCPTCVRPAMPFAPPQPPVIYYQAPAQPPAAAPPAAAATEPAAPASEPAVTPCDCSARLAALDKRIAALENAPRPAPDVGGLATKTEVAALAEQVTQTAAASTAIAETAAADKATVLDRLKSVAAKVQQVAVVAKGAKEAAAAGSAGLFAGWGIGLQLAAILGFPPAVAGVGGLILYRVLRKRLGARGRRADPFQSAGGERDP